MIRRLNFTGRQKIARWRVTIRLLPPDGGTARHFEVVLNLTGMELPDEAHVFVEAYHRNAHMRFAFGRVGQVAPPEETLLEDIDPDVRPLFRVKVVESTASRARILAVADKILPIDLGAEPDQRQSILPVEYVDLGQRVWHLDMDRDWPTLCLNKQIPDIRDIARADRAFHALVYPEVVRRILQEIVSQEAADEGLDEDDWPSLWLRYVRERCPGLAAPPTGRGETAKQDKLEWVADAVEGFAASRRTFERFMALHSSPEETR
ncbi:MAG: hypothetical protein WC713_09615 [Candidatus Methylomirabilota bacterium]